MQSMIPVCNELGHTKGVVVTAIVEVVTEIEDELVMPGLLAVVDTPLLGMYNLMAVFD